MSAIGLSTGVAPSRALIAGEGQRAAAGDGKARRAARSREQSEGHCRPGSAMLPVTQREKNQQPLTGIPTRG